MWRGLLQKYRDDHVKHAEEPEWLEQRPKIAKVASIVAKLEIRPSQYGKQTPTIKIVGFQNIRV